MAVYVRGRHAVRQHLFCDDKALLDDVPVYAGTHQAVEFVGKMVFADKKFAESRSNDSSSGNAR